MTGESKRLMDAVGALAREAQVFGEVRVNERSVECAAPEAPAEAWYRLYQEDGRFFVEFSTPDRWLSHSIEADLLNTGDKIEQLVEEEMGELGVESSGIGVEHFRDDGKRFVFRTCLPVAATGKDCARAASLALRAYEACFRRLGDVGGAPE